MEGDCFALLAMTDEVATSLRIPQGVWQFQFSGRDCFALLAMTDEVATSLRIPQGVRQSQLSGRDCFASLAMTDEGKWHCKHQCKFLF